MRKHYLIISLICFALCFGVTYCAHADWLFAICPISGGQPVINQTSTPIHGWVLSGVKGTSGAYLFSGTAAQLTALSSATGVIPIVSVANTATNPAPNATSPELSVNITAGVMLKINQWLTANGRTIFPSAVPSLQAIQKVFTLARPSWQITQDFVTDK